ncbi:MAG: Glycerol-3-phosphate dehydrogenase (NAD(P)+) [candidate division BRC1 bacterium ADurb.BinA364]|nr:MAG: Glycerol-3-phosphate dehydrogenase (NAD(P)+) [candidate division BRC1 bacterium ADurb.BinA364]
MLGVGTWGLSLACLLHGKGVPTCGWDAFPQYLRSLDETRKHPKLPQLTIPRSLRFEPDLARAAQAECLVLAPASYGMRAVCEQLRDLHLDWSGRVLALCSKGLEEPSRKSMRDVALETLGDEIEPRLAVLTGPSHAEEVSRQSPTTVVAASSNPETAARIQATFFAPAFRVYTHDDVIGAELGGALKNVIAIAAGICHGLGFGDNAAAALITRGLAEITRLGVALGAREETFSGLAGMGDLIVTAMSRHSRNRNFGEMVAQGLTVEQAKQEIGMAVEGIRTCASAVALAKEKGIDMPIAREVYAVLYEAKNPAQAARDLMLRDPKPERRGG